LFAQSPLNIGIKVGANISSDKLEEMYNNGQVIAKPEDMKAFTGFVGGLFARLNLGKLYLQPELLFSMRGVDVTYRFNPIPLASGQTEPEKLVDTKIRVNSFDLPVMVGYKILELPFAGNLRILGGPVFMFTASSNTTDAFQEQVNKVREAGTNPSLKKVEDIFSTANVGFQVGAGIDITKLTFDARFELPITKLSKDLGLNTKIVQLSLGWKFL
jgi:hypothetical protein